MLVYFTDLTNVEIHMYSGKGRENATKGVEPNDGPVLRGKTYKLNVTEGSFYIVVTPNEGEADTRYEFLFWVEGEEHGSLT